MSQLRCDACGRLWSTFGASVGARCGVRLSSAEWCGGRLVEHGCGGPRESCGLRHCEECGGPGTEAAVTRARAAGAAEERARIVAMLRREAEEHVRTGSRYGVAGVAMSYAIAGVLVALADRIERGEA